MGKITEVDAISDAIIETEREIAGEAWDQEETERDNSGRSPEEMGEGLEGQHEADDDEEHEDDESEGTEESEAEREAAEAEAALAAAAKAKGEQPKPGEKEPPEGGRVPSGKLREANEARRAAEAERDALKAQIEKATGNEKSLADRLDLVMREINDLKRPREAPRPAEQPKPEVVPDIFEDPKGFAEHLTRGFQTELNKRDAKLEENRVETSMAIAHAFHKEAFEGAFKALTSLPLNPDNATTVQRIYRSPNPGEALVAWHKRNQTFAEVGDDPAAYRERVAKETREALMKDPEFKKQILAGLREDALRGEDGQPRTTTRLPRSLNGAQGSNVGVDRGDPHQFDDTDQAVADAAWR
jgi:hypothetical protein